MSGVLNFGHLLVNSFHSFNTVQALPAGCNTTGWTIVLSPQAVNIRHADLRFWMISNLHKQITVRWKFLLTQAEIDCHGWEVLRPGLPELQND
jgi:hypothetical protein